MQHNLQMLHRIATPARFSEELYAQTRLSCRFLARMEDRICGAVASAGSVVHAHACDGHAVRWLRWAVKNSVACSAHMHACMASRRGCSRCDTWMSAKNAYNQCVQRVLIVVPERMPQSTLPFIIHNCTYIHGCLRSYA